MEEQEQEEQETRSDSAGSIGSGQREWLSGVVIGSIGSGRTGAACDDRRQLAPGELVLHDHPRDLRGDESPTSFERGWWLTALC